MNIEIRKSFQKDSEKLPASTQILLERIIQNIIAAKKIADLPACKKLSGYKTAYRLRAGNYRIGFFYENETAELVRVLNRKDIYKYFP